MEKLSTKGIGNGSFCYIKNSQQFYPWYDVNSVLKKFYVVNLKKMHLKVILFTNFLVIGSWSPISIYLNHEFNLENLDFSLL